MADLETIQFTPMREVIENRSVRWEPSKFGRRVDKLPQIFWDSGEPWSEANHWALTKVTSTYGGHIKTATSLMAHLVAYASWLESMNLDWRHFPMRKQDRAVVLYRGELIALRDKGSLAPSTARARMAAVIQFYRHAKVYDFVDRRAMMWQDRAVVVRYFDSVGFERALVRISSELAIPNRHRPGLRLEDGLTPLRSEDSTRLLEFTKRENLNELNLMLSFALLTGARIGTITTLGVRNIECSYPDDSMPNFHRMRVGPGTGVQTKGDVLGELLVPSFLVDQLKSYIYSMERLRRQSLASEANRGLLFLSTRGNQYGPNSINPLMSDLRKRAVAAGLRFMRNFKFHQTRATYGTWLMELALRVAEPKAAVAFVRDAMLHKHERTTFLYVRFNQEAPIKALISNEFSAAFSGVVNRDWNRFLA